MKNIAALLLICVLFSVGCAKKVQKVQSVEQTDVYVYISDDYVYGNQTVPGEKYFYFTPCNIAKQQKTILLLEEELAKKLEERGYRQILDKNKADMVFQFNVMTAKKSLTKGGRPIVSGDSPSTPAAALVDCIFYGAQLINKGLSFIKYDADYLKVNVNKRGMEKSLIYSKQICGDKKEFVQGYVRLILKNL